MHFKVAKVSMMAFAISFKILSAHCGGVKNTNTDPTSQPQSYFDTRKTVDTLYFIRNVYKERFS